MQGSPLFKLGDRVQIIKGSSRLKDRRGEITYISEAPIKWREFDRAPGDYRLAYPMEIITATGRIFDTYDINCQLIEQDGTIADDDGDRDGGVKDLVDLMSDPSLADEDYV